MTEIRCHPAIVIYRCIKMLIAAAVVFLANIGNIFDDGKATRIGKNLYAWIGVVALVVVIISVYFYLAWRKTYFRLNSDSLVYDKRTSFFKKKVSVKLENISTVNIQRGIFDYIFKTCTVKIDSSALTTSDKRDFTLIFSENTARQIEQYISDVKTGKPVSEVFLPIKDAEKLTGQYIQNQAGQEKILIVKFGVWQVIRHSLLSVSIITIIALGAAFAGVMLPFVDVPAALYPVMFMIGIPGAVIVTLLWSVIRALFLYYGFTVSKNNDEVTVSFGLITKRSYRLPINKTNAVVIRQTLLGRICSLYRAEIINVGMGDKEDKVEPFLCLMTNKSELMRVLSLAVPDFCCDIKTEKQPVTALPSLISKAVIYDIVLLVISYFASASYKFIAAFSVPAILIFSALVVFLSMITKGILLNGDKVVIANGVFSRKYVIVPCKKIQAIETKTGPIGRLWGVARGNVKILAPIRNRIHETGIFKQNVFKKIDGKLI